jgi:hypothetical protein
MFIHGAKISRSDVSAMAYKQTRSPQPWTMKRSHSHQVQAVVGALGVAVAAMRFYQMRELLAALLIFSLIFCIVGMALLILFLIQEVTLKGLSRIEARVAYVCAGHSGVSSKPDKDQSCV